VDTRAVSTATSYPNIPLSAAFMAKQKGVMGVGTLPRQIVDNGEPTISSDFEANSDWRT